MSAGFESVEKLATLSDAPRCYKALKIDIYVYATIPKQKIKNHSNLDRYFYNQTYD